MYRHIRFITVHWQGPQLMPKRDTGQGHIDKYKRNEWFIKLRNRNLIYNTGNCIIWYPRNILTFTYIYSIIAVKINWWNIQFINYYIYMLYTYIPYVICTYMHSNDYIQDTCAATLYNIHLDLRHICLCSKIIST